MTIEVKSSDMGWKSLAEHFEPITCVLSVEKSRKAGAEQSVSLPETDSIQILRRMHLLFSFGIQPEHPQGTV